MCYYINIMREKSTGPKKDMEKFVNDQNNNKCNNNAREKLIIYVCTVLYVF